MKVQMRYCMRALSAATKRTEGSLRERRERASRSRFETPDVQSLKLQRGRRGGAYKMAHLIFLRFFPRTSPLVARLSSDFRDRISRIRSKNTCAPHNALHTQNGTPGTRAERFAGRGLRN
ncbi:unnamed protein product [Leptosia nina]|uniref:Uncharacterized protein n=1 Tax=Leptosia nina TaxID=320188 RepID=A0AAV1JPJ1_9NEOP